MKIMDTIIFVVKTSTIQCDLNQLRQPNTRYVLVGKSGVEKKFSEEALDFFDEHYFLDNITEQTLTPIISKYKCAKLKLVTADESCILPVAQIRKSFRLQGEHPKEVIKFIDKTEMKASLENTNIRRPLYTLYNKDMYSKEKHGYLDKISKSISFPIFAKPVDKFGGIGCKKIDSRQEFIQWADTTFTNKETYEIDEFIEGELFHIDSLVKDSKTIYTAICQYTTPIYFFAKGVPFGSKLLPKTHPHWQKLNEFNENVIQNMKMPNGATHLEVFVTPKSEIIFLEIGARPLGSLIPQIYKKNLNIDFYLHHFKLRLNQKTKIEESLSSERYYWLIFPNKTGVVKKLNKPDIKSPHELTWSVKEGGKTTKSKDYSTSGHNYSVKIILRNTDIEQLDKDYEKLKHFQAVEVV